MLASKISPRKISPRKTSLGLPAPRVLLTAAACSLVAGGIFIWSSLAAPEPPARPMATAADGSPWAGVLAAPGVPASQDSARPTSASYAAAAAPQPESRKPVDANKQDDRKIVKAVLPPRRPAVAPEPVAALDPMPVAREPAAEPPRNRFVALVADRLPAARDTIVRPFRYVGDTVGDWVRKF